ncbi:MAG: hypothetical protein PHE55_20490 [Methylococcaceae bacterium]|nr:hypothetical protein [Methylococcaceae bacterium]
MKDRSRLNLLIDHQAKLALTRLAKHQDVTQGHLLEQLILERQLLETYRMSTKERNAYYVSLTP